MMTMIIVVDLDIFRCFLLVSWYCRNGRKAWIRQKEHHFSNSKNRINEINDHGHRSHNNNNNVNSKNNAKKKNSSNRYQKNDSTTDFDPLPQLPQQQKQLGLRYVTFQVFMLALRSGEIPGNLRSASAAPGVPKGSPPKVPALGMMPGPQRRQIHCVICFLGWFPLVRYGSFA